MANGKLHKQIVKLPFAKHNYASSLPFFYTTNFHLKYLGDGRGIFLCNKKHKDCPSFVDNKCYIGV